MNYTQAMEERHRFNAVTRYLHSFRFKHAIRYVREIAKELGRPPVVMDIGCGPGNVYSSLKEHCDLIYVGVELCEKKAAKGNEIFANDENAKILCQSAADPDLMNKVKPDIIMALETFEHIPPNDVMRIIERIRDYKELKLFLCSVPIEIGPAIWIKNIGSALIGYKRHKEYTWAETFLAGIYALNKLPRHDCRHKGFDWRWLAHTLRMNMTIRDIHTSPYDIIPAAFSPSIMFVCERDKE